MTSSLPSKIPRYEKSASSCSISDDSLTKHLTALWERDDSTAQVTSAAAVSRAGNKRKAASVSSYLSATKPDLSLPLADTSNQPTTSTILSQLLSSCAGAMSPVSGSVINSVALNSLQMSLQKNILLAQKDRQNVAAAKQPSAINASSLPLRRSATESISTTNNIFRLPTYEQTISCRSTLASPLAKAENVANDVFLPSPQTDCTSSAGNSTSSVLADDVSSAAGGSSSVLLNQSATDRDSAAIASHMMLDDNELLRQLEQILSEPGLSQADIDNVLGGCLAIPPSLPQALSAVDQKAISLIQSQLMSMETSQSSSSLAVANTVGPQWRNGALCQLLSGNSPLTTDALSSTDKSQMQLRANLSSADNQPLLSTAVVKSSHTGAGQYECVLLCEHKLPVLIVFCSEIAHPYVYHDIAQNLRLIEIKYIANVALKLYNETPYVTVFSNSKIALVFNSTSSRQIERDIYIYIDKIPGHSL